MPQTINEILVDFYNLVEIDAHGENNDDGVVKTTAGTKTRQAIADLILGLPELQETPIPNADDSEFSQQYDNLVAYENLVKQRIRQAIAEALGVSETNQD